VGLFESHSITTFRAILVIISIIHVFGHEK
jgi:hypothetical protein